ncbi:hypothetical protein ABKN59_010906 [Abortiporus biennis]
MLGSIGERLYSSVTQRITSKFGWQSIGNSACSPYKSCFIFFCFLPFLHTPKLANMFPLTLAQVKDLIPTATCLTDHFKQLARPITIADLQVPSSLIYRQVYATECGGVPIIIKFGTHVFKVEVDVMDFVAKNTSIRVPMVHAFLFDDNSGMGFLIEKRLPGRTLKALLPAMDQSTQETIIKGFRNIYSQFYALSVIAEISLAHFKVDGIIHIFIAFHNTFL